MTSQIANALTQGFTSKQVLDFLIKHFPAHSKQIQKAISSGFTAEQVLKFISGGRKELASEEMGTEHARVRGKDIQKRENVTSGALKGAGLAGLGVAGAIASPMAAKALQRAAPQLLGPGAVTQGSGSAQIQLPPNQQQSQGLGNAQQSQQPPINPNVQPNIPQPQAPIQPEVKSIDIKQVFSKYPGFESKINDLIESGNDIEAISTYFKKFNPSQTSKLEKEAGRPIEEVISEYMKVQPSNQPDVKQLDNANPMIETATQEMEPKDNVNPLDMAPIPEEMPVEKIEEKPIEVPKIEKGSTVASPQGIGEIKEIRNGKAIIEVDGKKIQVDESELENPKYTEEEIADAYDKMFEMIPEEHRSGFIQWAGYNEDENSLGYIPRGGKYEKIYDITPEEAQMIKEGKGKARTSGEEREGIWVIGEDTRGGVISQIVHDRRRKHEAVKKQQLEFPLELLKPEKVDKGMKPIFDELSYPRDLSRARDKKKADEERARKKAEKERLKKEKEDEKRKKKRQG